MISPRLLYIALLWMLPIMCTKPARAAAIPIPQVATQSGCRACHPFELGINHLMSCVSCHKGDDRASTREVAHIGMDPAPAAPDRMREKCGPCHARQTANIDRSRHFTLSGEINPVRRFFGATQDLDSPLEIASSDTPSTPLELVDDLLRRRCLRCHVYYRGDDYGETRHGTGCAACHLDYRDGKLVSHRFLAIPDDRRCLACHYGNRVGGDFYGFFEHDLKYDYRTPFQIDGSYPARPYGVEEHRLQPDIHRRAGMGCLDCHGSLHRGAAKTIGCAACHDWRPGQTPPAANLTEKDGKLLLKVKADGGLLPVPRATDPAHARFGDKVDCAVCHARWSYDDLSTQLLRTDVEDYRDWANLIVQGSSEVESTLLNGLYGDEAAPPIMTDKFSGDEHRGLWLKTFKLRRWEALPLGLDGQGMLRVMRPTLDLHLSWVDDKGQTVFDATGGAGTGMRPYTPHTIGKAGPFYWLRLREFFPQAEPGSKAK